MPSFSVFMLFNVYCRDREFGSDHIHGGKHNGFGYSDLSTSFCESYKYLY